MITVTGRWEQLADIEKKRKTAPGREPMTPAHAADLAATEAECGPDGHCYSKPVDARKAMAVKASWSGPRA